MQPKKFGFISKFYAISLFMILILGFIETAISQGLRKKYQRRASVASIAPLSYQIDGVLRPESHEITGRLQLRFINTSMVFLNKAYLHLYLNAFSHSNTLFMKKNFRHFRLNSWDPDAPGWIRILNITGKNKRFRYNIIEDGTVLEVGWNDLSSPKEEIECTIFFESRFPRLFARTGFADNFFMVAQWYPKLGYLNRDGSWFCPPFYPFSEFSGNFASFNIRLTTPKEFVIGTSGVILNHKTIQEKKIIHIRADLVHDIAFALYPDFTQNEIQKDDLKIRILSIPGRDLIRIKGSLQRGLHLLEEWLIPYPYTELTVLDLPTKALGASAMEYPTLFTIWTPFFAPNGVHLFDETLIHELVHQFFYGIVATNEVLEPWLDEGLTSYMTWILMDRLYGKTGSWLDVGVFRLGMMDKERLRVAGFSPPPVAKPAFEFDSWMSYTQTAYARSALLLRTIESIIGRGKMIRILNSYVNDYAFSHPSTKDFINHILERVLPSQRSLISELLDAVLYRGEELDYGISCSRYGVVVKQWGKISLPITISVQSRDRIWKKKYWDGKGILQIPFSSESLYRAMIGPDDRLVMDDTPIDNSRYRKNGSYSASWSVVRILHNIWQLIFF